MDAATRRAYERGARKWIAAREHNVDLAALARFARRVPRGGLVADLGCGPGWYGDALRRRGLRVVGIDVAGATLKHAGLHHPKLMRVQADLAALPCRDQSLDGAWANHAHQHLPRAVLPAALARLHWAMKVGAPLHLTLARLEFVQPPSRQVKLGEGQLRYREGLVGDRLFSYHSVERVGDLLEGAGFERIAIDTSDPFWMVIHAQRARTLPDLVGPRLRVLICGLNPSLYSADRGVAFARPGNRFWPAALAAGLIDRERDPLAALARGIGMTDLVKRASARADALSNAEYSAGITRLERLVRIHRPRVTCFVGLDGWRKAVDARATPGWITAGFAGRPAYLMPSTSGANAHSSVASLAAHLAEATKIG
jgi:TDG/mug DNA glycosylase family protein